MSRSRKRTPVWGMSSSSSEKQDKRDYNRRYRRISKQFLHVNPDGELMPHLRDYSNPWCMSKDGKKRFDPKLHPERMRK
ncbi:MAG TPA: hypothetical protein VM095_20965 [Pyrinomonadaceae bacterium]|jgi:hypothetical protein|nr:hypothetical protein [Pyrinomonadaceae bacterium]